uniref:Uncharacterized protein n=1 Tax=Candidatus Methanogaster sp. ANME-2c ERB4 TaxID=2759911 RepID=A0A7G9YAZ1_9EURY|nr:hypothetical protein GMDKAGHH_00028 [Methanosarcinales archaeon ANME-2c ERB4]
MIDSKIRSSFLERLLIVFFVIMEKIEMEIKNAYGHNIISVSGNYPGFWRIEQQFQL